MELDVAVHEFLHVLPHGLTTKHSVSLELHRYLVVPSLDQHDAEHSRNPCARAGRQVCLLPKARHEDVPAVSVRSIPESHNLAVVAHACLFPHLASVLHDHLTQTTFRDVQYRFQRSERFAACLVGRQPWRKLLKLHFPSCGCVRKCRFVRFGLATGFCRLWCLWYQVRCNIRCRHEGAFRSLEALQGLCFVLFGVHGNTSLRLQCFKAARLDHDLVSLRSAHPIPRVEGEEGRNELNEPWVAKEEAVALAVDGPEELSGVFQNGLDLVERRSLFAKEHRKPCEIRFDDFEWRFCIVRSQRGDDHPQRPRIHRH
mmetsp:Transcript_6157/g.23969  ORF Transcript_6157/g.23969 Transcript_6157/m.23969 type:complete len:314 (-) Transcript_6157:697-1638(-)